MNDPNEVNDPSLMPSQNQMNTPTSISNNLTSTTPSNASSTAVTAADPVAFIKYLKQFVPALLDANNNATLTNDFEKCMNDKTSIECIKKFLAEAQVRTLIIQKFLSKGNKKIVFTFLKKNSFI